MNTNQENISELNPASQSGQQYRFRLMQGIVTEDGKFERSKTVGMAHFKYGKGIYTLRLWTFLESRFYLISSKVSSSRYLVMTREPTKNPLSKNKYHWNIVGNGRTEAIAGVVRIQFDLFEQPVYMRIFPETSHHVVKTPKSSADEYPESFETAA